MSRILFTHDYNALPPQLFEGKQLFVVTDSNVANLVSLPAPLADAPSVVIPAGEEHKNISTVCSVWQAMTDAQLTRSGSMVVNFGGGVVTDLGGFAAATFKRGIPAVNIPTTLLGAIDAAVGGKTGIDFDGLKNQVGCFAPPEAVVISAAPFASLPDREFRSGLGEMLKHALLEGPDATAEFLQADLSPRSPKAMMPLLKRSVEFKEQVVRSDPFESGPRKALNLGHTIGHALEALNLSRCTPLTHGEAVARGLVAELALSNLHCGFPSKFLYATARWVRSTFGPGLAATCNDYPTLLALMANDKKNTTPGKPTFTLLEAPGSPLINATPEPDHISAAMDIARDLLE